MPAAPRTVTGRQGREASESLGIVALIVRAGATCSAPSGKNARSSPFALHNLPPLHRMHARSAPFMSSGCSGTAHIRTAAATRRLRMPRGKDACGACSATVAYSQEFVVRCGKCLRQFHCECVGIKNEDLDLVVVNGVSTFKCFACTRRHDPERAAVLGKEMSSGTGVGVARGGNQPDTPPSEDTLDLRQLVRLLCQKVDGIATDVRSLKIESESLREDIARDIEQRRSVPSDVSFDGSFIGQRQGNPSSDDLDDACSATRRQNASCDDLDDLRQAAVLLRRDVEALTTDVRLLKGESDFFRVHLAGATQLLGTICLGPDKRAGPCPFAQAPKTYADALRANARHCVRDVVEDASSEEAWNRAAVSALAEDASSSSTATDPCRSVSPSTSGMRKRLPPRHLEPVVLSSTTLTSPKQRPAGGLSVARRSRRPPPSMGTCADSTLSAAPKQYRRRALFVSRLHPSTTGKSVSEFVDGVTGGAYPCVCTRLPSKYDSYTSFHVSVSEKDFEGLLRAELWPAGCLFRPFRGVLKRGCVGSSAE
ncbi:uncharacterized protein LOC144133495 [Amblyomma americanum]